MSEEEKRKDEEACEVLYPPQRRKSPTETRLQSPATVSAYGGTELFDELALEGKDALRSVPVIKVLAVLLKKIESSNEHNRQKADASSAEASHYKDLYYSEREKASVQAANSYIVTLKNIIITLGGLFVGALFRSPALEQGTVPIGLIIVGPLLLVLGFFYPLYKLEKRPKG